MDSRTGFADQVSETLCFDAQASCFSGAGCKSDLLPACKGTPETSADLKRKNQVRSSYRDHCNKAHYGGIKCHECADRRIPGLVVVVFWAMKMARWGF